MQWITTIIYKKPNRRTVHLLFTTKLNMQEKVYAKWVCYNFPQRQQAEDKAHMQMLNATHGPGRQVYLTVAGPPTGGISQQCRSFPPPSWLHREASNLIKSFSVLSRPRSFRTDRNLETDRACSVCEILPTDMSIWTRPLCTYKCMRVCCSENFCLK